MKLIPNMLSIFRICLVPVFIIVYFTTTDDNLLYPVLVYALASFSDILDGYLARRFKASSALGMVLDPLGDKLMTISVMACITIDGIIPLWAVLIAGTKEALMAIGGLILHRAAHIHMLPPNILGKTSTVTFFLVCATLMLFRQIPENVASILISFAIALTLLALASYLKKYTTIMKERGKETGIESSREGNAFTPLQTTAKSNQESVE